MSLPAVPGYEILGPLGSGGEATVWRARSTAGETVALKLVPLARISEPERHLREVWAAGSTGSRHVVAVREAGRHGEVLYLAMELAAGDAAQAAAAAGGRLPPERATALGRDAGRGLQVLAEHGFVHRDVKPANILLRADGSAMIGDLAPARGGGTAARSADLAGTPAYLAPEQAQGLPPDARSDVYGLAAAVFALIAGRPPFQAGTPVELLRAIVAEPAPRLGDLVPGVPDALDAVLARALAKLPEERQRNPGTLAADFEAVLAGRAPAVATGSTRGAASAVRSAAPAPVTPRGRHVVAVAAVAVAAAAGLAVGALAGRPSPAVYAAEREAALAAARGAVAERARAADHALAAEAAGLADEVARLRAEHDALLAARSPAPAPAATAAPRPPPPTAAPAAAPPPAAAPAATPAAAPRPAPSVVQIPAPAAASAVATRPAANRTVDAIRPATRPAATPEPLPIPEHVRVVRVGSSLAGVSSCPDNPQLMVAWSIFAGVWRSGDGGATWQACASSGERLSSGGDDDCQPLAQWAGDRVFIAGWRDRVGMLSNDRGRSFAAVPLPPGTVVPGLPAAHARSTRFVTLADGSMTVQVLREDGRWAALKDEPARARPGIGARRLMLPDGGLAMVSPAAEGGWRLLRSADGGSTWSAGAPFAASDAAIHPLGDGLLLLACGAGGRWGSSRDGGRTWDDGSVGDYGSPVRCLAGGIPYLLQRDAISWFDPGEGRWCGAAVHEATQLGASALAIDPRDPRRLYAACPYEGLMRSVDGGRGWTVSSRLLPDDAVGLDLAGNKRPRLSAAGGSFILQVDLARGDDELFAAPAAADPTLVRRISAAAQITGYCGNPDAPDDLLVLTNDRLQRTRDGGRTWDPLAIPAGVRGWSAGGRNQWLPRRKAFVLNLGASESTPLYSSDDGATVRTLPAPWPAASSGRISGRYALLDDGSLLAAWSGGDDGMAHVVQTRDGRTWQAVARAEDRDLLIPTPTGFLLVGAAWQSLEWCTESGKPLSQGLAGAGAGANANAGTGGWSLFAGGWCRDGARAWVLEAHAGFIAGIEAGQRKWSVQMLAGLGHGQEWSSFAVDPLDPRRMWLACERILVHTRDGGRTWRMWPERLTRMQQQLEYVRGAHPRLRVLDRDDTILDLDAGPAGEALFSAAWVAPPD